MPKEYRTIQEVAGPLMLVHGVENVPMMNLVKSSLQVAKSEDARFLRSMVKMHWYSYLRIQQVSTFQTVK